MHQMPPRDELIRTGHIHVGISMRGGQTVSTSQTGPVRLDCLNVKAVAEDSQQHYAAFYNSLKKFFARVLQEGDIAECFAKKNQR